MTTRNVKKKEEDISDESRGASVLVVSAGPDYPVG
jgi:hypothetical protein